MNFEAVKITRGARGINLAARALAFDLALYAGEGGEVCVSAQRLADDLGTDERWVRRLLNELIGQGLLEVARKGNGRGQYTTYRFVENTGQKTMVSGETKPWSIDPQKGGKTAPETMVYRPPHSKYASSKEFVGEFRFG